MSALLESIASYVPALSVRRFAAHPVALTQPEQERFQAVRARLETSINVACSLVRQGRADGVLSIGHGHSQAKAVRNSIATAQKMIQQDVLGRISHVLKDVQTMAVGQNSIS